MPEPKKNRESYLQEHVSSKTNVAQDFTAHLQELRNRILIALGAFVFFAVVCFSFSDQIIIFLEHAAPEGSTFFQLKPGELFMSSMKVSFLSALVLSLPVILSQIAFFLSPGLKDNERKVLIPLFWISPVFFILGLAFAYYFALPPLLKFLLGFREGVVETTYGLEYFLNLEISILGLCGIAFQLPIVLIILSLFGLVNSKKLLSIWRYVIMGAFVVAAVLTPTPDPVTMTIVASALLGLYFGTVLILRFAL